mmetsp:Transcript_13238/g.18081  ORF Transcript_13238/g.18081 Transcript_13238/m.18081 type:complete len:528 (+) Transcript_13238:91-1674(+)|eukprot:CAMPEP_0196581654 /NCGR_PEP_ID=MMETSP1081-20130531/34832_1 /TAXON_ID=36882 /ORGANISM="Pyramimonas amylifera, Strain CCMP720" /LENGTH=527 /DNA_ID=CAMNT_0041901969 /DNA_START=89 /DNA_END=1672 /DNA_ORIENTATION=+
MNEDKTKKYDRQLRIWGEHGQAALENSKVFLLNCGATGSEALKNLVLGGIASFTIVDASRVGPDDLGTNFMVEAENLGEPKAKCVCATLQELNELVTGSYVEESPETLIESAPESFASASLVIATQMTEVSLLKLDALLRTKGVPLLIARSYGLMGYLRASFEEVCVVESKPEPRVDELRLGRPWAELQSFMMSFWPLEKLDPITHAHLPWGVLLLLLHHRWTQDHAGCPPATAQDKKQIKAMLQGWQIGFEEENFSEAKSSIHKVWAPDPQDLSSDLRVLLQDPQTSLHTHSPHFWVMVAALKSFFEEEKALPLDGALPDMFSSTEIYVELQRLYREKSQKDATNIAGKVRALLKSIDRPEDSISFETVRLFCRNARFLKIVRCRSLEQEYSGNTCLTDELQHMLTMEDTRTNAAFYVLLRAADHINSTYGRFPGTHDSEIDEDVSCLKHVASSLLNDLGVVNVVLPDDLAREMVRFGASELHCVGAVIGGMIAQEAIKIITGQFVPLEGGLIYNAISSTTNITTF